MELALTLVTIASLTLGVAASVTAWRALRSERRRSDARVAALTAAAYASTESPAQQAQPATTGAADLRLDEPFESTASPARSCTGDEEQAGALFRTVRRPEPRQRGLGLAAGLALVLLGVAFASMTGLRGSHPAPASVEAAAPLDLLSLAHLRVSDGLQIAGTVRNPATGARVEGLTAVISLLDQDGSLISTKDVPLDYRALGPGEEAPFSVTIPDLGSIRRYRVSFRSGKDTVPHVDRRSELSAAARGV